MGYSADLDYIHPVARLFSILVYVQLPALWHETRAIVKFVLLS
jgi:hypothetical protein